ncbi:MAG: phosphoglycerate kinase [Acidobacteria bacterium]|nr:phosphoglycerate kinase [Acidobacteriota bacterium]
MPYKTIDDLDLRGKRAFIRVDFNVPLDKETAKTITSDTRIRAALPTIQRALDAGAAVILASHLGRPEGRSNPRMTLAPVAARLAELLGRPVEMASDCIGPEVKQAAKRLKPGEVLLLENLRFHPGEEANDAAFAQQLAALCDVYINDAFGAAHRAHGSTAGIVKHVSECAAGLLMQKELQYLAMAVSDPQRPYIAIVGGAKISGKIDVIDNFLKLADRVLIGGAMTYTFLKAQGLEVGGSLVEEEKLDLARETMQKAGGKLLLPADHVIAAAFSADAETRTTAVSEPVPAGWMGLDIGPATIAAYEAEIARAKLIVWNGPMHTSVNPGGLFRAQLTRMERVVLRSAMSPANENPPIVGLDASGSGSAEILFTRDENGVVNEGTLHYDVRYNFPGAVTLTGLHIHPGAAGANGPARLRAPLSGANSLVDEDGAGAVAYKVEITAAADLDALGIILANPANAYLNLHTTDNPGGAVRGQLQATTESSFQFSMSSANEVPPIEGLDASAVAKVSLFAVRDAGGEITSGTVIFDANYMFPGSVTFRGFHIHDGEAGVNGPVRINSGLSGSNTVVDEDSVGNLLFAINVGENDAAGIAALRDAVVNPHLHYLNLHSSVNPGGAIRGQLGLPAAPPTILSGGVVNGTFAAGVNMAAPGSIVSIFGANLARFATGAAVVNGSLTTSLAGTSVLFASVPAPLLYVGPGQINAQFPYGLSAGPKSVRIVTSGGSVVGNATARLVVSAVAPSIFAIVNNSNFAPISASSPVAIGGAIAVFTNGLGAGTPAVATGQLPPASPLSTTITMPTATIGGVAAEVAASLLAPGLAGVAQVNVIVAAGTPSGV